MGFFKMVCRSIDALNEWVGKAVSWVTLLLVLVVFADVVMRYAFNTSSVFTQELEWQLFSFIFLVGAGYTLLHDGHVRVDIVYQQLSPKGRAWVNLFGVLLCLIPGCIMVIFTCGGFAYTSWLVGEGSPDPGGIPYRFVVKSAISLGFVLLLLQGVSLGIRSVSLLFGRNIDEERVS